MSKFITLRLQSGLLTYVRSSAIDRVTEDGSGSSLIDLRERTIRVSEEASEIIDMLALEECPVDNNWPERGA